MKLPLPDTGLEARIQDLEIIATGDVDKINARIDQVNALMKEIADSNPSYKDDPEYKALAARKTTLEAAKTRAGNVNKAINNASNPTNEKKEDKNSKRSEDDLAYWSGRVWNASTNAFSASVNGLSVGVTGFSFSFGLFSESAFLGSLSQCCNETKADLAMQGVEGITNKLSSVKTQIDGNFAAVKGMTTGSAAINTLARAVYNLKSAMSLNF